VDMNIAQCVIIESGAPVGFFIQAKPERLNQMQAVTAICREPDNVSGIWWNLRRKKNDLEHQMKAFDVILGLMMGKHRIIQIIGD